ncbi:hypothetical protein EDD22DRAFT_1049865 [Suillus occidentalis]|nr:hypothetical protein EDD22DRAFT_1049865 [Suillus occidentalis]
MSGSSESRYIRLDIISRNHLNVPSWRVSADASPVLSVEIRASYEADRMLGSGEVIGKLQMSWDELLNHGDEPFDLSFPPVRGVHPSLTLKAVVAQACDDQECALPDSLADCEIPRQTDAGHAQFAEYVASETDSHLNAAVEHFQLVLDKCPACHPDHAAALTNLAWARLDGYTQNDLQDIDTTISLFRDALALRPQRHPDRPFSIYNLSRALIWRHSKKSTVADIREAANSIMSYCLSVQRAPTFVASWKGKMVLIILPTDASDEGICLRRVVLELCPVGHQRHLRALGNLSNALKSRFTQSGNIDDLDECIQFLREAASLCPEGHTDRGVYLNHLAYSLDFYRFDHQGNPNDLDEAISLHEEALRLRPVGHKSRDFSLDNLGGALVTHFEERDARAYNWTVATEQHGHVSALEAYTTFFELLDAHLATRSSATSRREAAAAFHYARTLPVDAASCAIHYDNLRHAVELVEQGRGQQWSLASRLKTPVEDFESANSTLARNYLELSKRVSNAAHSSATITDRAAADCAATEYRKLTRQWEAAVAEIRNLKDFSRFLLPPAYEDLQAAARHGPVIILIASEYSCDVIIVPASGGPRHVPVPSIVSLI